MCVTLHQDAAYKTGFGAKMPDAFMLVAVQQLQKVDQAVRVGDPELGIAVGADDHNMFHNIYMYQVQHITIANTSSKH
jgi:hypothetical protein